MTRRLTKRRLAAAFRQNLPTWRMLFLSVTIGIIAGFAAILFHYLLEFAKYGFLDGLAGFRPDRLPGENAIFDPSDTPFNPWVLLFLPALGGLLGGLLVTRFAPEAAGPGTDAAIDAYHHRAGSIRARVPFIKLLASTLTIGTGGSAGREGPIAQIGSGLGYLAARHLKLSARERRILMAAGMAAGIGAIFRAPLAGALFAAEVLYRELDLEYEVIIPSIISSIVGYAVYAIQFGWDPLFSTPDFVHHNPLELLPYLILAFAVVIGASAFIRGYDFIHDRFTRLKVPLFLKPAIGGLIAGMIGFFFHDALGTGYGIVQRAFDADSFQLGITMLLAIAAAKILTTSFSIASGGSGGVFGPSIVIGGCIGGAVGLWMRDIFANFGIPLEPGAFVVVGMAGFFATAANTPISTIIMVSEMTGNYQLLVPTMWVCVIAYLMMRPLTLYKNQIQTRFDAPVHRGDMMDAILTNVRVRELLDDEPSYRGRTFTPSASLHDVLEAFAHEHQSVVPIVDPNGELIGMIGSHELRSMVLQENLDMLLIAEEVCRKPVTVTPSESLLQAVRKMTAAHLDELLVVAENNTGKIIGSISQRDIVLAYNRRLIRMVRQDEEEDDTAESSAITLHKLIDDEAIVMPVQPGSKQQIMEQLIAPLAGVEHHCRPDHLLEQLMERENKMTTAIMPHIALPHAQNLGDSGLRKAHLVVGICPEGTDFGSMDGEPTHVFFLICSLDQRSHLKTMADLARLIRNPGTVEALRKAASAEDVMRIMQSLSG